MSWLLGIGIAIAASWLALIVCLLLIRPRGGVREALRLLPDTIRLLRGLATDRHLPRGVRVRLWMLFAYLAMPFDLIPDFIPVIGYADDAILVIAALRSIVRRSGLQALHRHWPGSEDGFAALAKLAGLVQSASPAA